tara:strand:- start:5019 stop:5219 length:201 start_codon:yes stop_codon:yes gene_type:complete
MAGPLMVAELSITADFDTATDSLIEKSEPSEFKILFTIRSLDAVMSHGNKSRKGFKGEISKSEIHS